MKIFFCYEYDDNECMISRLREDLIREGYDIWIDKSEIIIGNDWRKAIMDGISSSDMIMFFAGKHSIRQGSVCMDELSNAISCHDVQIQCILLEEDIILPENISDRQYIDISDWKQYKDTDEFEGWYQEKLQLVLEVINNYSTE